MPSPSRRRQSQPSRTSLLCLLLWPTATGAYDQCRSAACYNAIIDQELGPSVGYLPASHENDCIRFVGASSTETLTGTRSVTSYTEVGRVATATVWTYSAAPAPPSLRHLRKARRPLPAPAMTSAASPTPYPTLATSTSSPPWSIPSYAASACPASSDYSEACSCAGVEPSTSTVPYSATSTVATSTYTQTYYPTSRVTATSAACRASDGYGASRGSVSVNNYHLAGLPAPVSIVPAAGPGDCCARCYGYGASDDGCIWWSWDEGRAAAARNETCSLSIYGGGGECPTGQGHTEAKVEEDGGAPLVGIGPCAQSVDVFIQY